MTDARLTDEERNTIALRVYETYKNSPVGFARARIRSRYGDLIEMGQELTEKKETEAK